MPVSRHLANLVGRRLSSFRVGRGGYLGLGDITSRPGPWRTGKSVEVQLVEGKQHRGGRRMYVCKWCTNISTQCSIVKSSVGMQAWYRVGGLCKRRQVKASSMREELGEDRGRDPGRIRRRCKREEEEEEEEGKGGKFESLVPCRAVVMDEGCGFSHLRIE